jgi:hypothetical protein
MTAASRFFGPTVLLAALTASGAALAVPGEMRIAHEKSAVYSTGSVVGFEPAYLDGERVWVSGPLGSLNTGGALGSGTFGIQTPTGMAWVKVDSRVSAHSFVTLLNNANAGATAGVVVVGGTPVLAIGVDAPGRAAIQATQVAGATPALDRESGLGMFRAAVDLSSVTTKARAGMPARISPRAAFTGVVQFEGAGMAWIDEGWLHFEETGTLTLPAANTVEPSATGSLRLTESAFTQVKFGLAVPLTDDGSVTVDADGVTFDGHLAYAGSDTSGIDLTDGERAALADGSLAPLRLGDDGHLAVTRDGIYEATSATANGGVTLDSAGVLELLPSGDVEVDFGVLRALDSIQDAGGTGGWLTLETGHLAAGSSLIPRPEARPLAYGADGQIELSPAKITLPAAVYTSVDATGQVKTGLTPWAGFGR